MNQSIIFIFGAGSGIGKATFDRLSTSRDCEVYGFSRRGDHYTHNLNIGKNHAFDLTKSSDYEHFSTILNATIEKKKSESSKYKLIIYFAQGDGLFKSIEKLEKLELEHHFELNLFSSFRLLQIFFPYIGFFEFSTIIFLSSTAGRMGFSESTAYCASKHAISGLAKALREEWKPYEVKVVTAYLGAIATSIWDSRPNFPKNEMITVLDASEFLASLSFLPHSLYLDEIFLTPKNGVL